MLDLQQESTLQQNQSLQQEAALQQEKSVIQNGGKQKLPTLKSPSSLVPDV